MKIPETKNSFFPSKDKKLLNKVKIIFLNKIMNCFDEKGVLFQCDEHYKLILYKQKKIMFSGLFPQIAECVWGVVGEGGFTLRKI
jgi:hypothetical protein